MLKMKNELSGLPIAPVMSELAKEHINKIPNKIPFVFIDSCIGNNYLSYIGQNSFNSGALSGKLMDLSVRITGSIAVINVISNDYHIDNRIKGFLSYFKKLKKHKVINCHLEEGKDLRDFVNSIIKDNKDLRCIFVPSVYVGKIAEYTKNKKLSIIGYDLTKQNESYVKTGRIDFLINQRPELQGHHGILTLFRKIVLKEKVDKN